MEKVTSQQVISDFLVIKELIKKLNRCVSHGKNNKVKQDAKILLIAYEKLINTFSFTVDDNNNVTYKETAQNG